MNLLLGLAALLHVNFFFGIFQGFCLKVPEDFFMEHLLVYMLKTRSIIKSFQFPNHVFRLWLEFCNMVCRIFFFLFFFFPKMVISLLLVLIFPFALIKIVHKTITQLSFFLRQHEVYEAVAKRCSVKQVLLKVLQKSHKNTYVRVFFLIKLQVSGQQLH